MSSIESLKTAFAGVKGVTFATATELGLSQEGDRVCVVVENAFGRIVLALNGAHLVSWVPAGRADVLWLSPRTQMVTGKPIRGGIPLCTPWFGPGRDDLPLHGWGRITDWTVEAISTAADGSTTLVVTLPASGADPRGWSVDFDMRLAVTLGRDLGLAFTATNRAAETRPFEFAYHTYFAVGDVDAVSVDGLDGCRYIDRQNPGEGVQTGAVRIDHPMNRIYGDPPAVQVLASPAGTYRVESTSKAALIWNPGAGAATVPDLGEGTHRGFVCLERIDAAVAAVELAPGASHSTDMVLSVL